MPKAAVVEAMTRLWICVMSAPCSQYGLCFNLSGMNMIGQPIRPSLVRTSASFCQPRTGVGNHEVLVRAGVFLSVKVVMLVIRSSMSISLSISSELCLTDLIFPALFLVEAALLVGRSTGRLLDLDSPLLLRCLDEPEFCSTDAPRCAEWLGSSLLAEDALRTLPLACLRLP